MTNDSSEWADDQRFGQLFAAADSDHGKFGRKSLDVVLFFVDKAARISKEMLRFGVLSP